ncbi:MAG: hypothetical protein JHD39_05315 [Synechococcus sp. SupBloom_Metag_053]|nr:hypothetical protein [Synechococcus sp. SupBloom_Metag_053]
MVQWQGQRYGFDRRRISGSYLKKAQLRREILTLLANREGWSDLVREAEELGDKFR